MNRSVLLIDSGNSAVKWCFIHPGAPHHKADIVHNAGIGELTPLVESIKAHDSIDCALVGHVGRDNHLSPLIEAIAPVDHRIITTEALIAHHHMTLHYEPAHSLGVDRALMALAVSRQYPRRESIIISLGTTMTVDYINEDGEFAGGVIIPSIKIMNRGLIAHTNISAIADHFPASGTLASLANTTADACSHGALLALLGAIRLFRERYASPDAQVIITGGDAATLSPYLDDALHIEHLVLSGLSYVAGDDINHD